MVKQYRILYILLLLCMASCRQEVHETAVAFYNCENLFDTTHNPGRQDEDFTPAGRYHYTAAIYNEKLHNIAAVIARMVTDDMPDGPAVIGLAEVENDNVLQALVHQPAIARRHYRYVWYNGPDKRGINVALLYNPGAFTIISSEPLTVKLDSARATRDILHVYGTLYGDSVHILVNHWPSRLGGEEESEPKRMAAAAICRQKVNELLRQDAKVIVMGDFNENPTDTAIACTLGAKEDSNEADKSHLYNPWANRYKNSEGTLFYQHHWYLFDQVIISGSFLHQGKGYQFDKTELFKPSFITDSHNTNEKVPHRSFAGTYWTHGYSDHFPVLLYLKK